MAESEHTYEYGEIPLPAFPHVGKIPVARDEQGRVWFPVRPICEGLRLANAVQQRKIQDTEDYEKWRCLVPFGTVRGDRDYLCVEFELLGIWLGGIQESRTANDDSARYIAAFRQAVWTGANRVLWSGATAAMVTGRPVEIPCLGSAQAIGKPRTIGQQIVEDRLTYLEDTVALMVNGSTDTEHSAACPHCGKPIVIHTGPVRVLKGH
jgi:hypothetical protein